MTMLLTTAEIDRLMDQASLDDGAFGALSEALQDRLFRFALANGLNRTDAAEAVQETFLRAYRARKRWRKGGDVACWFYGITMNVVREMRRKDSRRAIGLDLHFFPDNASPPQDSLADSDDKTLRLQKLSAALRHLPPRQGEAIACRFLRRMSIAETAGVMGCAEGTVKAAVHAALESLRQILNRNGLRS